MRTRGGWSRGGTKSRCCAPGSKHAGPEDIEAARAAGIQVFQAPIVYSQKLSFARRILAFARYVPWAIRTGCRQPRPDVVYASSTPLTVGEIGRRVARHHRIPFIFEVRDLWPEVPIALGVLKNPLLQWAARRMARKCYRAAAQIVALSPDIKNGILRWGVEETKVSVVPNCSDPELFGGAQDRAAVRRQFGWKEEELVCIHPGAMGIVNGLDALVDCGKALDAQGGANIRIALVGSGALRSHLETRIREEGVQSVSIHDAVCKKEMPALLAAADIGLVTVAAKPGLEANSANKFFDFLAAGLPVVINYGGWQAQVLRESGAGRAAPAGDAEALARILIGLRDDLAVRQQMGRAARRLAVDRYDRGKLVGEIEDVLRRAVALHGGEDEAPSSSGGWTARRRASVCSCCLPCCWF
jgi:glycosyltransferase involved in cell wall biosynthesis